MKVFRLFIFLSAIFLLFGAQRAFAAITVQETTAVYSDGALSIEFLYADKARIAVEKIDLSDNQVQIGFYPSSARVIYRLTGKDLVYRSVDSQDWYEAGSAIEVNKIVVKQSNSIQNEIAGQSIAAPEKINTKISSASSDQKLTVKSSFAAQIKRVFAPVKNGDKHLVSSFYEIETGGHDSVVELKYDQVSRYSKVLYYFDQTALVWQPIVSYHDVEENIISAELRSLPQPTIVAAFEDYKAFDGIASFYDQSRYGTFGYKNGDFAASRDYPKGTKLKVTRLKTGDSVVIEVNDFGPEEWTGRLIDLDVVAFEKLSSRGAGLIYVKVEPLL